MSATRTHHAGMKASQGKPQAQAKLKPEAPTSPGRMPSPVRPASTPSQHPRPAANRAKTKPHQRATVRHSQMQTKAKQRSTSSSLAGQHVVLLLSGGLDSAVLLWQLSREGAIVHPLVIDYGQAVWPQEEAAVTALLAAQREAFPALGGKERGHTLRLPHLATIFGENALTAQRRVSVPQDDAAFAAEAARDRLLYVPNRNAILLALAYAYAVTLRANAVAIATFDHHSAPDAGTTFTSAFANVEALALAGTRAPGVPGIRLLAPFSRLHKSDIVALGHRWDVPFGVTWTCAKAPAKGQPQQPCGLCPLCRDRLDGFARNHLSDPAMPAPEPAEVEQHDEAAKEAA